MITWIYVQSERTLWTVGYYDLNGQWFAESDYATKEEAAKRVHYLNGGKGN